MITPFISFLLLEKTPQAAVVCGVFLSRHTDIALILPIMKRSRRTKKKVIQRGKAPKDLKALTYVSNGDYQVSTNWMNRTVRFFAAL